VGREGEGGREASNLTMNQVLTMSIFRMIKPAQELNQMSVLDRGMSFVTCVRFMSDYCTDLSDLLGVGKRRPQEAPYD